MEQIFLNGLPDDLIQLKLGYLWAWQQITIMAKEGSKPAKINEYLEIFLEKLGIEIDREYSPALTRAQADPVYLHDPRLDEYSKVLDNITDIRKRLMLTTVEIAELAGELRKEIYGDFLEKLLKSMESYNNIQPEEDRIVLYNLLKTKSAESPSDLKPNWEDGDLVRMVEKALRSC